MRCVGNSSYQSHDFMTNVRLSLLLAVLLPLVFVGCDAAGSDTIFLETTSDDTQLDPIFYKFRYTPDNLVDDTVKVVSEKNDDPLVDDSIDDLLKRNGFSRKNVVSATVEEATLIRRSDKSGLPDPKVFQYLDGGEAKVFLGSDSSGKLFAESPIQSDEKRIALEIVGDGDVTSKIKSGTEVAFLRLVTTGGVSGEDVVDVKVSYRIEVSGV